MVVAVGGHMVAAYLTLDSSDGGFGGGVTTMEIPVLADDGGAPLSSSLQNMGWQRPWSVCVRCTLHVCWTGCDSPLVVKQLGGASGFR